MIRPPCHTWVRIRPQTLSYLRTYSTYSKLPARGCVNMNRFNKCRCVKSCHCCRLRWFVNVRHSCVVVVALKIPAVFIVLFHSWSHIRSFSDGVLFDRAPTCSPVRCCVVCRFPFRDSAGSGSWGLISKFKMMIRRRSVNVAGILKK